jgi:hypothetical protein
MYEKKCIICKNIIIKEKKEKRKVNYNNMIINYCMIINFKKN